VFFLDQLLRGYTLIGYLSFVNNKVWYGIGALEHTQDPKSVDDPFIRAPAGHFLRTSPTRLSLKVSRRVLSPAA